MSKIINKNVDNLHIHLDYVCVLLNHPTHPPVLVSIQVNLTVVGLQFGEI